MKQVKISSVICFVLGMLATRLPADITGADGWVAKKYYVNPHAGTRLIAFDWDAQANLYYSVGNEYFDVGFTVYKKSARGVPVSVYNDANSFAGSRMTRIGQWIYFNDGGTYTRFTCDYYKIDPATSDAPHNLGIVSDIFGLETRDGTDFWAAGGFTASIYYSPLQKTGGLKNNPLTSLGTIGNASGPMAFDPQGNLYYAEGYVASGHPVIYRWSAQEVAAAIANPAAKPLKPEGHVWARLNVGAGVTGIVVDHYGNIVVTATSFTEPSELRLLLMSDGKCVGDQLLARSDGRLETLRLQGGVIYVSSAEGIFSIVPDQTGKSPLIADVDGDQKADFALYQPEAGSCSFKLSQAGYQEQKITFGGVDKNVALADFDGDRKADPAAYDEKTGLWQVMLSAYGYATAELKNFGGPGAFPLAADFDGDGLADPCLYWPASGTWQAQQSSAGYQMTELKHFGGAGYAPVVADFDGDGLADPAVYQETSANWKVMLSASGYYAVELKNFGGAGYELIVADYDGDGLADPAVYQMTTGNWKVMLSASGYQTVELKNFGGEDYEPMPADCDGDGLADPVVWHAESSTWYALLSSEGYQNLYRLKQ